MSENSSPQTAETREEPPDTGILQTIRDEISQALGGLFRDGKADVTDAADKPKPGGDPAKPPPADVEGQMRGAVAAVLEEDKKKTALETELQAMRDELAGLKALVEKPPEQFRPIERMWREP